MAAALAPYAWRDFTESMLARRVVGAVDRHDVACFLAGIPGVDSGPVEAVHPADPDDYRVDALVRALGGRAWRHWSLDRLCADLLSSLTAWLGERESFDSDLRRLLDER